MARTKASAKSLILPVLSCAILLAISMSTVKLWEVCQLTIGASLASYTVPALFCVFAVLSHFSEKMLSTKARRAALTCTYFCKLVTSAALALHMQTDMICHAASKSGEMVSCPGSGESGQFAATLVALCMHHPAQVTVPVMVSLFFLVLGDVLALALEFLYGSVEEYAVARRLRA